MPAPRKTLSPGPRHFHHGLLVEEGRVDLDLFGNAGAEHFSRALRRPGEYRVRVGSFMEELGEFSIGATWLPVVAIEVPPDPDGSPDTATMLVPGTPLEDTLGSTTPWETLLIGTSSRRPLISSSP